VTVSRLASLVPALLLALGCGSGGASEPDAPPPIDALPPDAPPRETISENMLLVPGELAEGIMTGGNGDLAVIHLDAPRPEIDWNIHGHANGSTQVLYEGFDRIGVDHVFAPAAQADWFLLVRNGGATDMTVLVRIQLYGNMQWRWQ
jgi:hypothetical protein